MINSINKLCKKKDDYGRKLVIDHLINHTDFDYIFDEAGHFDAVDLNFTAVTYDDRLQVVDMEYTAEIKVRTGYHLSDLKDDVAFLEVKKFRDIKKYQENGRNVAYMMYWPYDKVLHIWILNDVEYDTYEKANIVMRRNNWNDEKILKEVILLPFNDAITIK